MNNNVNGMIKINENTYAGSTRPMGFLVREKLIDGKPVTLEYGTWLSNDIYLGVPIHFSLKEKLIPVNFGDPEYNYYYLPETIQLAVSSYRSKKTGKVNPLLITPNDKRSAVLISSLAFGVSDMNDKIININLLDENSRVLRKYIDKDRHMFGLIIVNKDYEVMNPTTSLSVTYGKIGSHMLNTKQYDFGPFVEGGVTMKTNGDEVKDPINTEFINLPMMFAPKKEKSNNHNEDNQ